ncbi:MAG: DUF1570 domain-containing protein [Vicinamibacterales bacterium]
MRLLCTPLLLTLLATVATAAPAEPWKQLQSQNFTVMGRATDTQLKEVAGRLEQFRAALSGLVPDDRLASRTPVVVTVFPDRKSNRPFMPRYHGRTVDVAGLFLPGPDVSHLTLNAASPGAAFPVVFHEYVHLLVGSMVTGAPLWLHEGLAEFYSTFETDADGRTVHVGGIPQEHVLLLRKQPLLPLRELFAVTHDSPLYNEGTKRSVFYAESWALMHYLLIGNPARTPQLATFLEQLATGLPIDASFRQAFQTDPETLAEELRQYVRRSVFRGRRWAFGRAIDPLVGRARRLSATDVRAHLADLHLRLGDDEEALERLLGGSRHVQPTVNYLKVLGRTYIRQRQFDLAVATLEQTVSMAPADGYAHYYLGLAHMRRLEENGRLSARNRSVAEAARRELLSALEREPRAIDALAQLGLLESLDRDTLASGRSRLERAVELAPARPEYRLALGELQVRQGDYGAARANLSPLAGMLPRGPFRARAIDLLAAANDETRAPGAGAPLAARALGSTSEGAPGRAGLASLGRTGGSRRSIPTLRTLGAGESQAEGRFVALDCTDRAVVARFATQSGGGFDVSSNDLGTIQFISYRTDVAGSLRCGARSGEERVLVTWVTSDRAPAGTGRSLVSVEFLPDGYDVPVASTRTSSVF